MLRMPPALRLSAPRHYGSIPYSDRPDANRGRQPMRVRSATKPEFHLLLPRVSAPSRGAKQQLHRPIPSPGQSCCELVAADLPPYRAQSNRREFQCLRVLRQAPPPSVFAPPRPAPTAPPPAPVDRALRPARARVARTHYRRPVPNEGFLPNAPEPDTRVPNAHRRAMTSHPGASHPAQHAALRCSGPGLRG